MQGSKNLQQKRPLKNNDVLKKNSRKNAAALPSAASRSGGKKPKEAAICANAHCRLRKKGCAGFEGGPGYLSV